MDTNGNGKTPIRLWHLCVLLPSAIAIITYTSYATSWVKDTLNKIDTRLTRIESKLGINDQASINK